MGVNCCSSKDDAVAPPTRSAPGALTVVTTSRGQQHAGVVSSPHTADGKKPFHAPCTTTAVSQLVRNAHFLLRTPQLREAQHHLPSTAKYLAWHLVYDSVQHGGLSKAILYQRCLQCMRDNTGILTSADRGSAVSTGGEVSAPGLAHDPSRTQDAHDEDATPDRDRQTQGSPSSPRTPTSSFKKRGRQAQLSLSAGTKAHDGANLAGLSSEGSPLSPHRRRQRRCVLLIETQYVVCWHPAPNTTAASRGVLCHLGVGVFLNQLPAADGTVLPLKPEDALVFTFLVPQRAPLPLAQPQPSALRDAGGPPPGRQSQPAYAELDIDDEREQVTNTSPGRANEGVPHSQDVTLRPSSVPHSPDSSSVSLDDVILTAHPEQQRSDATATAAVAEPTAPGRAVAPVADGDDDDDVTVFSTEETVVVLYTHFRVGRALHRCRKPQGASAPRGQSAQASTTAARVPPRVGGPLPKPVIVQAVEPMSTTMNSNTARRTARGVATRISGQKTVVPRSPTVRPSFHSCAVARTDSPPLIELRGAGYSNEQIGSPLERGQSILSDATLSSSFAMANPESSTIVIVSPSSTLADTMSAAGVAAAAGTGTGPGPSPYGLLTDFTSGPVMLHERVTSMFPTPPSTTTNTQSMGFDGSAGDMYSPFSATNGLSPMNDDTYDAMTATATEAWTNSPLLHLRFFPFSASSTHVHASHDRGHPGEGHHTCAPLYQMLLLTTLDGALSLWAETKTHHSSRKQARKGTSPCLRRSPDVFVSPDLTQVTLNLNGPLFCVNTIASRGATAVNGKPRAHVTSASSSKLSSSSASAAARPVKSDAASRTTAPGSHGLSDDEAAAVAAAAAAARDGSDAEDSLATCVRRLLPDVTAPRHAAPAVLGGQTGYFTFPFAVVASSPSSTASPPLNKDDLADSPWSHTDGVTSLNSPRTSQASSTDPTTRSMRSSDGDGGSPLKPGDTQRGGKDTSASSALVQFHIAHIQMCTVGEW